MNNPGRESEGGSVKSGNVVLFQEDIQAGTGKAGCLTGFFDVASGNRHQVMQVFLLCFGNDGFPMVPQRGNGPGRIGTGLWADLCTFVSVACLCPSIIRLSHLSASLSDRQSCDAGVVG